MAWPTTPATTTHLDAGTDDPNLARPQIKQNVENVNAIIDEFGDVAITSPTDGQVLAYNLSNTRWENADSSGGGAISLALLKCTAVPSASGNFFSFSEDYDPSGIVSLTSNQYFNLASGSYYVMVTGIDNDETNSNNVYALGWRNFTQSTNVYVVSNLYAGGSVSTIFTANGTDQFGLRATGTVANLQAGFALQLIKIS